MAEGSAEFKCRFIVLRKGVNYHFSKFPGKGEKKILAVLAREVE